MKAEFLLVRALEVLGGLFMLAVFIITCIVFAPYFVPKAILEFFRKPQSKVFLDASILFILIIAAYLFLSIISIQ